jgi:hypothetical protein
VHDRHGKIRLQRASPLWTFNSSNQAWYNWWHLLQDIIIPVSMPNSINESWQDWQEIWNMRHLCCRCNIGMIWTCSSSSWNRCNDLYWSLLLAAFLQIEFHLSFLLTVLWNAINNPGRWSLCFIKCEGFLAMICDSYRSSTTSVTTVWPILRPHFLKRKYILRNSQCIEPPVQSSILLCFGRAI